MLNKAMHKNQTNSEIGQQNTQVMQKEKQERGRERKSD